MIFQPRKSALYKLAIEHGVQSPEEINAYLPLGSSVPSARLDGWLQQLFRPPKTFSPRRRYINRFKLGADPEFVIAHTQYDDLGRIVGSSRVDASAFGFAQGPAFGADNNGRLAEIRPHPSRSAVEVLASVLCTLRWMALQCPETLKHEWFSGAYLWEDGIGGHVHFGRKRPTRKEEVAALDAIEEELLHLGMYPKEQVLRRRQGDARRQIYGALGDYRIQTHGYEYRTFPSWLDSPELAFITLVAAKLAVQVPSLFRFKGGPASYEQARFRNWLAYFKGVDDDARLALMMLSRGFPAQQSGNFAPRWGITPGCLPKGRTRIQIIPPSIKPDDESVTEMFEHLMTGKPLGFRMPECTWSPTAAPAHYKMCLPLTHTIQAKGLGELIWDLCCHEDVLVTFINGHKGGTPLMFAKDLVKCLPVGWKTRFEQRATYADLRHGQIIIAPEWREGPRAAWTRKALLNGLLPLWSVKDCKEGSYEAWQRRVKTAQKSTSKLVGKVLFESQTHKVGPLAT